MKFAGIREVKTGLSDFVEQAQKACVVIMRHGRPAAVMIGVDGQEIGDVMKKWGPKIGKRTEARR